MGTRYSTVTVSGYSANPPSDDGAQTASNQVKYSTTKVKIGDPLKTAIEAVNSGLVTFSDFGSRQITTSDTSVASDHMKTIEIGPTASAAVVVSLGDAATMAAGYIVTVKNSSANSQTVGRITAGDKIDNVAQNITLPSKCSLTFKVANTASEGYLTIGQFGPFLYDKNDPRKVVVQSAANISSGSTRLINWGNGDVTFRDFAQTVMTQTVGADIASAGTINLDTATGDLIDVTGTTNVSAVTLSAGREATVRFVSALILVPSATLILPTSANITTAAGDVAVFRGYASSIVRCVSYTRANGTPLVVQGQHLTLATEASGVSASTSIDFTGIPSWVKRIMIMFVGVSTNGTSNILIQIGDAGGIETSGYISQANHVDDGGGVGGASSTAGFIVTNATAAAGTFRGCVVLDLEDASDFTVVAYGILMDTTSGTLSCSGGSKATSAVLDRVRLTIVNGTDTFDAGSINISYE
jgi:hypothetical protein